LILYRKLLTRKKNKGKTLKNLNKMKTFKIEVPNGYEIDEQKSTFENIVFKEVKKQLPKTFNSLDTVSGWYADNECDLINVKNIGTYWDKSGKVFATKEQAEASLALAQLSQLREVYRNGWKPDWTDGSYKYCIYFCNDLINFCTNYETSLFLSFQDRETRDLFLENFRDLIEQAKPLMS
jgi:hypothetical protein